MVKHRIVYLEKEYLAWDEDLKQFVAARDYNGTCWDSVCGAVSVMHRIRSEHPEMSDCIFLDTFPDQDSTCVTRARATRKRKEVPHDT